MIFFRHASRYTSPERNKDEDRLAKQNENLIHYIESWFTLAKELIHQFEQLTLNNHKMIDDEQTFYGSSILSDNEITNPNLLCQLKVSLFDKNLMNRINLFFFFVFLRRNVNKN